MTEKKHYCFCLLLLCLLLISTAFKNTKAQEVVKEKQPSINAVESLQRQIEEQKTQIEQLRAELKEEAELRKQQQTMLENLLIKLEKLNASLVTAVEAKTDRTVAVNPPASEKPSPTETAQAKTEVKAEKQIDKQQNAVESGLGKIKFTGLIQGWFAAGDRGFNDTFRIRRAELKFTGDLLPKVKWTVMLDLAKVLSLNNTTATVDGTTVIRDSSVNQSSRIFQEAYITLGYFKRANVNIGQFKIPLSQEGLQSSSALDTVERALFLTDRTRGGGLGDARDIGVMVFGGLNKQVDYQFGVFNGTGESQNDVDRNDRKAFVGRLVFRPEFIKGLQIGGSGAFGNGSGNARRDRLGAELVYDRKPFRFKSEFMTGVDGDIHRRGFYAHVGYRFIPKLEGIFRFDMFDPDIRRDTNAANVVERDFITGINYYIKENNLKLQINYLRKTFLGEIVPSRNQLLVNLQTSW